MITAGQFDVDTAKAFFSDGTIRVIECAARHAAGTGEVPHCIDFSLVGGTYQERLLESMHDVILNSAFEKRKHRISRMKEQS